MQVKGHAFLLFCLCVSLYELCVLLCQVKQEKEGLECRIGNGEKRPFSGVTCCVDFCAHSHKDLRNMDGGATLVNTIFSFIFIFFVFKAVSFSDDLPSLKSVVLNFDVNIRFTYEHDIYVW